MSESSGKASTVNHLRTLGALSLKGPDGAELRPILAQPKRLALLVYLSIAKPQGCHRRDTLLGIFWPDLDEEHARGALSRALYYLRRSLGEGVILTRGDDEIEVVEGRLLSDVAAFDSALDSREFEAGVDHYRGDFLEGFHVSNAPEFDRWLDAERRRLRERAAEAVLVLANQAESTGNLALAVRWARRRAALLPYDEDAFRRLAGLLDRVGDLPAATIAYEAFATRLKNDLDLEVSTSTQALVAGMKTRDTPAHPPTLGDVPVGLLAKTAARTATSRRFVSREGVASALALTAVLLIAVVSFSIRPPSHVTSADSNSVAVLPFQVIGDLPRSYLQDGLVNLIASRLDGDAGPRAIDPQSVVSTWRLQGDSERNSATYSKALLHLASEVRAGEVLDGSVVKSGKRLILNAHLLDVRSGSVSARVEATSEGSFDSLPSLCDHLVGILLATRAGEEGTELAALARTSLPALKAYLDGKVALRQGRYVEAARFFDHGLSIDSDFVLAAAGLVAASGWTGDRVAEAKGQAVLDGHRDSGQGTIHPERPTAFSLAENVIQDEVVARSANTPGAWSVVADTRFHGGSLLGADIRSSLSRAAADFRRALALDPGDATALSHLVEASLGTRDSAGVRYYGTRYLAVDSAADLAGYVRWLLALSAGDSSRLQGLRSSDSEPPIMTLVRVIGEAQLEAIGLEDANRAADALQGRVGTPGEVKNIYTALHNLALNAGRPVAAALALEQWRHLDHSNYGFDRLAILDALYWDGDSDVARRAVEQISRSAFSALSVDTAERADQLSDLCAMELWRINHRDLRSVSRAISELSHARPVVSNNPFIGSRVCAMVLEAMLARTTNRPDQESVLDSLDLLLGTGPDFTGDCQSTGLGNLVVARLLEERGDLGRALMALRRRSYIWYMPLYLSSYLREEGRLAALNGDREEAVHSYTQYLALRHDPEPAMRPGVDLVRGELARLLSQEGH